MFSVNYVRICSEAVITTLLTVVSGEIDVERNASLLFPGDLYCGVSPKSPIV
jgi:hypothetical protein